MDDTLAHELQRHVRVRRRRQHHVDRAVPAHPALPAPGLPPARSGRSAAAPRNSVLTAGNPSISGSQWDVGLSRATTGGRVANLTFSFGLRYETQTNIDDWRDFAPRIGVAWAPGATGKNPKPKTVLRAGFGMFYDRFSLQNTLTRSATTAWCSSSTWSPCRISSPNVPPLASLGGAAATQTIQQVSANLRAPYYYAIGDGGGAAIAAQHHAGGHLHEFAWAAHAALRGHQRAAARHSGSSVFPLGTRIPSS